MTTYKILNDHSKNWWHYVELRKSGQEKEARKKERQNILSQVKNIRLVLAHGGYLSLGRCLWSFQCFEYQKYEDTSTNFTLSGYYDSNDQCYLEQICKKFKIPVIDTRKIELNEALCLFIRNNADLNKAKSAYAHALS